MVLGSELAKYYILEWTGVRSSFYWMINYIYNSFSAVEVMQMQYEYYAFPPYRAR